MPATATSVIVDLRSSSLRAEPILTNGKSTERFGKARRQRARDHRALVGMTFGGHCAAAMEKIYERGLVVGYADPDSQKATLEHSFDALEQLGDVPAQLRRDDDTVLRTGVGQGALELLGRV